METLDGLTLFITGPTYIREDVKKAALLPEFGHRDSENAKRLGPILTNLKKLAGVGDDYEIALIPGSGSNAMETSIRSLVNQFDVVLNISVGAFGDLYHKIAVANNKNAKQLRFDSGKAIDMDELEIALQKLEPDVVTFTHNETSTGVMHDIVEIGKLVRQYGAIPLVDGVSIFGGVPLNLAEGNIAMYSTATQKCLGCDAGLGIVIVHKDILEKAKKTENKGYVTDLTAHLASADKSQIITTPNCSLINQLYVQLDYIVNDEGINNRYNRHEAMMKMTHEWVNTLPDGFELFAPEGHYSRSLSAIRMPENFTIAMLKQVKENMREEGYLMDPGYGNMNKDLEGAGQRLTIRVGHMGDITENMLTKYLDILKTELVK